MRNVLLLLLFIWAVCLSGAAVRAAQVTYSYQGLTFGTGDPWMPCPAASGSCRDPWQGTLVIDLAVYPGRLAGSSLSMTILAADVRGNPCDDPEYGRSDCSQVSITLRNGKVYSATQEGWASSWPGFGVLSVSGFLDEFVGQTGYIGYFGWVFGRTGKIVRWQGANYAGIEGGFDPLSFHYPDTPGSDSYRWSGYVDDPATAPEIHTLGPGTWTMSPTTQVPLPSAAAGLFGGVVLLVAASRRNRQARPTD